LPTTDPSSTSAEPMTAAEFIATLGVNTHTSTGANGYSNIPDVIADLQYLGISNVRDGDNGSLANLITMAQAGIKFDFLLAGGGSKTTADIQGEFAVINQVSQSVPGSVVAVEGANEINNFPITYNGVDGLQGAVDMQEAIYAMAHSDASLPGVSVYYFTGYDAGGLGFGPNPAITGGLADYDNQHPYPQNGEPPMESVNPTTTLPNETPAIGPAVYTETGYSNTDTFGANLGLQGQAAYTLDLLMDDAKQGIARTYLYELLEEGDGFGLFTTSNSPTPAATAIHNLTSILADGGTVAPSATAVAYSINNLPSDGYDMTLIKSNGATDIIVWAEPQISPTDAGPTTDVTVLFGTTYQSVKVFDPTRSSSPIETLSNISSVVIGVTDHPIIIEVVPAIADPITDNTTLTLAGTTLTASSVTIGSGALLTGFGTVAATVMNAGTIEANGGVLDLSDGVTGTGALTVDAGATLKLANATAVTSGAMTANGTLDPVGGSLTASNAIVVGSTGELLGYGTVATNIHNSGTVQVNGGQLILSAGVLGTGALLVTRGALYLTGNNSAGALTVDAWVNLNNVKLTATTVTIERGGTLWGHGTVTALITNNGEIVAGGASTLDIVGAISGTGTLFTAGSTVELSGTTTAGTVTDTGALDLKGITLTAPWVTVASGGHLIGAGTVVSAVVNSGTIESNTGLLDVTGAVSGTGTLKIDTGETLEVGSTVASTQTAVFASNTGTLSLDHPLDFAGSITKFTGSDAIYLGGQAATGFGGYNTTTHLLTVLNGTTTIAQLTFSGSYTLGNFQVADNGLTIIDPPVTRGTTGVSPTPTFINASAGNDVIAMPAAGTGLEAISGFLLTNGDVLDFSAALKGTPWHGDLTQVGNFITAVQAGTATDLYLDPTGRGHGAMVATLDNLNTNLVNLLAHNAIKVN
jgi:hypothetical protein